MSSVDFTVEAQAYTSKGTAAARRMRRTGRVPGIIYGGGNAPQGFSVDHDAFMHKLEHEAFYSHILTLNLDGQQQQVVLRGLQRHPARPRLLHVDFQRINPNEKIHMQVPLHFVGEANAPGVRIGGGLVSHLLSSIDVRCLPRDLPEYIEVDLSNLELNHSVHLSDLKLPAGVEIIALSHGAEHDLPVASVHGRGAETEAAEAAPEAAAAAPAAPAEK